uniref:Transmembrane protein n=1 Tax=Plectus sambesii TaxID=2011161 RepID=A0A914WWY0_9BILA
MSGVYNELVEDALPSALFNNQTPAEQYFIKTKRRLGHLAVVQFILALAIVALGVYCYFITDDEYDYYYRRSNPEFADALISGIVGMICACFGLRVAAQTKGRCIFTTYFVLTIISAALTGISCLIAVAQVHSSRPIAEIVLNWMLRGAHLLVAVVSSAMICSIWGRIGGFCCCPESQPPIIYMQTVATGDPFDGETGQVKLVPIRRQ